MPQPTNAPIGSTSLLANISTALQLQLCLAQGTSYVYKLNTRRISRRVNCRTRSNSRNWKVSSASNRNCQASDYAPPPGSSSQGRSWILEGRRPPRIGEWSLRLYSIYPRRTASPGQFLEVAKGFPLVYRIARLEHHYRCHQWSCKPFCSTSSSGESRSLFGLHFNQHNRNLYGDVARRSFPYGPFHRFARVLCCHSRCCKTCRRIVFDPAKMRPNTGAYRSHHCCGLHRQRIAAFYREQKALPHAGTPDLFAHPLRGAA